MLLLIDNYDSFTYNLVQYLGDLGAEVVVKRNDALTAEDALAMKPDRIVLSPGPCGPEQAGICLDLIKRAATAGTPLLGVCLGHQAIGCAFGGTVTCAPLPMHGKISAIRHTNEGVLTGLPSPFHAARYHSLIVARDDNWPQELVVTATSNDNLCMALRHKTLPIHGVQFHPESIATEHGHDMLKNFLDITRN
jgi:anthranilate synthase component 2